MSIHNQVQLITYPDSMGGSLPALTGVLEKYFPTSFGGIHVLPPYPSTGDRGFAPTTYFEIDPSFGTWADIHKLGERYDVLLDVMVNHISRHSEYFLNFVQEGRDSPYADMFITLDKIWKDGIVDDEQFSKIFLRRPDHCFETVVIEKTGKMETVWATFGKADWSEQIDLDVNSSITREFFRKVLAFMQQKRVSILRLDAIAFITKKAGSDCFFVEPEIYQFLDWIRKEADGFQIHLLPEVHARYAIQTQLAAHGFTVYNFVLPMLILDALLHHSSLALQEHLQSCPRNQITMLDCHDGIPVQPDIQGIVPVSQARRVVEHCIRQGANVSRIFSSQHTVDSGFDAHQINCTYYAALECNDDSYLAARAIQFFSPGIPQVYYVGLLAGENDQSAVEETGEKRAINRHNYHLDEIELAIQKPVVKRLIKLIDFRNQHPAFNGEFWVEASDAHSIQLRWQNEEHYARLTINLPANKTEIEFSDNKRRCQRFNP